MQNHKEKRCYKSNLHESQAQTKTGIRNHTKKNIKQEKKNWQE